MTTDRTPSRSDPIRIVDADPAWAEAFEAQRRVLTPHLIDHLVRPIEHIGSTSVPGLPAKPIIDMLAVIDDHDSVGASLLDLEPIGWCLAPEPGDARRRRWSLCSPSIARRTHHLHVVERRSTSWPDWLLFRDHLRTNPADAALYADRKRELAAVDDLDRVRYRAAKAPLIAEILVRARAAESTQAQIAAAGPGPTSSGTSG